MSPGVDGSGVAVAKLSDGAASVAFVTSESNGSRDTGRPRAHARGRGAAQRQASAHRVGLSRRRAHRRADPVALHQGRRGAVGARDGRTGSTPGARRRRDGGDATLVRRAAELSTSYLGGRARPASVRWVADHAHPVGVVHAGRRHDPAVRAAARHAALGARLRPRPRTGAPARARPRAGLLGAGAALPAHRTRPRAISTASAPPPTSISPTISPTTSTTRRRAAAETA